MMPQQVPNKLGKQAGKHVHELSSILIHSCWRNCLFDTVNMANKHYHKETTNNGEIDSLDFAHHLCMTSLSSEMLEEQLVLHLDQALELLSVWMAFCWCYQADFQTDNSECPTTHEHSFQKVVQFLFSHPQCLQKRWTNCYWHYLFGHQLLTLVPPLPKFFGVESLVTDVYSIKTDQQFNTLED